MTSGASFYENLRSHRPEVSREHHKTAKKVVQLDAGKGEGEATSGYDLPAVKGST
jgi:hypothetical protein